MKKHLLCILTLPILFCSVCGCYFTQNPFADIKKQGTVIKLGEHITIPSTIGPVRIEYIAPTKRRIILNGESREFRLLKSSEHMGVFAETKFKQGSVGNIYGINYGEGTITLRSRKELQKYLHDKVEGLGSEHRVVDQMIVRCSVHEYTSIFLKKRKWIYITINKYHISDPKEKKPLWGYFYPVEIME